MKKSIESKLDNMALEVLDFYSSHSLSATAKEYSVPFSRMKNWLELQGALRQEVTPKQIRAENISNISKELVKDLYLQQNLSKEVED